MKADCINNGLYIDAWKVMKDWDEATLRRELGKLFSSILKDSSGEDIGFDFVRSVGVNLLSIKLQDGQDLNARVIKHISGTSAIYIKPLQSIDGLDGQEGPDMDSAEEQSHEHQPSTATTPNKVSQRDQLGNMFPSMNLSIIEEALAQHNHNMPEAIEMLLSQSSDVKDCDVHESDDSALMASPFANMPEEQHGHVQPEIGDPFEDILESTPLAAAGIVNLNGNISLQRFIEGAVKPFGLDMHVQVNRRQDMLTQMIRKYKNPSFDLTKPLNVEFVGAEEQGIDAGGVTRKYFYFLMESLKGGSPNGLHLFEGQVGHLVPKHDYDILSSGMFTIAGKMILHAVLNKCQGVPGVSPAIVSYLVTSKRDSAVQHTTLKDIPDPCLQEQLKQLLSCDEKDLPSFMNSDCLGDVLLASGYPHLEITPKTRSLVYECCLLNEVIAKRIPALEDTRRGLASIRVMGVTLVDLMTQHMQLVEHVFPSEKDDIDPAMLRLAMKYDKDDNDEEMRAHNFFDKYVEEMGSRDKDSAPQVARHNTEPVSQVPPTASFQGYGRS